MQASLTITICWTCWTRMWSPSPTESTVARWVAVMAWNIGRRESAAVPDPGLSAAANTAAAVRVINLPHP
jgi:hypothetical protein